MSAKTLDVKGTTRNQNLDAYGQDLCRPIGSPKESGTGDIVTTGKD